MPTEFKVINQEQLLSFLFNNLKYSKKEIKSFLKYGSILVNNRVVTKYDYVLRKNDIVSLNVYNKDKNISILYEDSDIIVVDKPHSMLVVSSLKKDEVTLYNLVSDYVKRSNRKNKIFIVHRLDYETSGVIVFAKTEKIKNLLQDNWNSLVINRKYVAIVEGKVKESGTIKSYLKENKNHYVYSSNNGKLAITNYKRIKEDSKYSWVDIDIKTGRKNQIRVHFKELGNSIVGDKKYGHVNKEYNRLCLHAYELSLINPLNNEKMVFKSPMPKIFN